MTKLRIDVVSIFPDYLMPLDLSLVGKAQHAGLLEVHVHDLREWTSDRHRTVDDTPYGGGAGMVMKPDVWGNALDDVFSQWVGDVEPGNRPVLVVPTPGGVPFSQSIAEDLAGRPALAFACGRYEGIDARVTQRFRDTGGPQGECEVLELSIGDYVLNGGEVAALVMIEAIARLVPGVIGNPESLVEESHSGDGLLEYPVFTKPPIWEGLAVPEILTSGDHGKIARWRRDQALRRTAQVRPDLILKLPEETVDTHDKDVLNGFGFEVIAGRFQIDARGMAE